MPLIKESGKKKITMAAKGGVAGASLRVGGFDGAGA